MCPPHAARDLAGAARRLTLHLLQPRPLPRRRAPRPRRGRPSDGPRNFLAAAGAAPSAPQRLWWWRSGAATVAVPTRTPTRGARGRDHPPPLWTWLPPPAPLPRLLSRLPVRLLYPHRLLCQGSCGGRGAAQQQSLGRSCDRGAAGSSGVGMVAFTQKPRTSIVHVITARKMVGRAPRHSSIVRGTPKRQPWKGAVPLRRALPSLSGSPVGGMYRDDDTHRLRMFLLRTGKYDAPPNRRGFALRATSVPRRRESRYQRSRRRRGVRPRRRLHCHQPKPYQMEGHARQPTRRGGADRERGTGEYLPFCTDVTFVAAADAAAATAAASTMTAAAAAGPPRYPSTVSIGPVLGRRGGESAGEGGRDESTAQWGLNGDHGVFAIGVFWTCAFFDTPLGGAIRTELDLFFAVLFSSCLRQVRMP